MGWPFANQKGYVNISICDGPRARACAIPIPWGLPLGLGMGEEGRDPRSRGGRHSWSYSWKGVLAGCALHFLTRREAVGLLWAWKCWATYWQTTQPEWAQEAAEDSGLMVCTCHPPNPQLATRLWTCSASVEGTSSPSLPPL